MKLLDILKTVGSGLISTMVPGGGAILKVVNGFLPDDNQLPDNATGQDAENAISKLSSVDRASVLNKEYDVKIEEIRGFTDRFKAMADVDKSGNTTRPQIAMLMAVCVVFTVLVTISIFSYAVFKSDADMIKAIVSGWPFITAVLVIPSALLRAYFAMRTKEKQQKYEAVTGAKPQGGLISTIAGLIK